MLSSAAPAARHERAGAADAQLATCRIAAAAGARPGSPNGLPLDAAPSAPPPDLDDELEDSLDIALALAAAGLPVFPCNSLKRPCIPKDKGGNGFRDASTDPDRIREMWDLAGPAAQLVGVPTGAASGFDVLDIDPRHGGDRWKIEHIDRLGETRIHGTPGLPKIPTDPVMPGEHWLFAHVDGVRNIQDGKTIVPGIDVRGQDGYVCFPPSGGYRVIHEADIAPWPDWLLPLVIKVAEPAPRPEPSSYATPAKVSDKRLRGFIDREVRRVRDAPVGARHGARLSAARSIGGVAAEAGLSDTEVEEMLIAARPPEVEEEKERRTIRDGLAYGREEPIDLNTLSDSAQFRGHRQHPGPGAAAPEPAPGPGSAPDEAASGAQPEPEPKTPEPAPEPDGEVQPPDADAQAPAPPEPEPDGRAEEPTDPRQAEIDRLAALPELEYELIDRKAKAEELGLDDVRILNRAVARARRAAKAEAKAKVEAAARAAKAAARAADKAAKAKAEAAAKAAKAEAKSREAKARADEKARKIAEARARLDAQRTRPASPDDDDDPLRDWTPPSPDALPEIIVAAGERHNAADAGLAAMAAARVPFYQRGKDLVRVCLIKLKLSNGKNVRVPAVSIITRPMLMRALSRTATWHTYNKELDLVRIDPPGDLGDHVLGMIGEWPFPPLRGVIATQTMRHDGSLLTEPGYDPDTGLVLFNPPAMPIPVHPTKADALDGLALLRDLLAEVAFAEDEGVSLSGAVSMLMTPVLRGMMPAAPIHVINKPDANSGGSYLQDLMSAIATGERCPTISLTLHNDEENEKRLSAAAILAPPIIAIDNFTGTLMGNFFCQLIERPMPLVRLLGKSEMVAIPNNHTLVANGINIAVGIDAVRRAVLIELDPNMENPYERVFTRDPVAEVLADRGKYIAAILTIARAYRLAGMPGRLPPRNSFEVWSDNVRSALVWLGWPDPDESIKTARDADPHTSKLVAVMAAWATDLKVGQGYFTSELVAEASEYVPSSNDRVRPALWDALFDVAGNKNGQLDVARLGLWLQAHLNRISAGHKLVVDRTNKARPRWSLEPR